MASKGPGLTGEVEGPERRDGHPAGPELPPTIQKDLAVRWAIGCLVAAVALIGVLLLAALAAFYLQPPAWVQIVLGLALAVGAAVLAWLVATAWGRSAGHGKRDI
ncbi:MAG: hypothetical protein M3198_00940 [Actinomycetota bacterium]|nr:hypothetical protein [Actinomycetota bacterium]